jgi:hypothetical protein
MAEQEVVSGPRSKTAGAGRGKINPQPVNVSDEDYVSPADQYQADVESAERKSSKQNTDAYNASTSSMKSGGTASSRADGIAQRGKTRGTIVMCGGGMYKK